MVNIFRMYFDGERIGGALEDEASAGDRGGITPPAGGGRSEPGGRRLLRVGRRVGLKFVLCNFFPHQEILPV